MKVESGTLSTVCLALITAAVFPRGSAGGIVGGKSIPITEAPWQLQFSINGGGFCGAVWLGGRWVMTAAHCAEKAVVSNSFVHAGLTKHSEARPANRVAIARIISQPNWQSNGDIALMELAADITAPLAKPIAFATRADSAAGLTKVGAACFATGWGGTGDEGAADSLRGVMSKIHSHNGWQIRWAGQGGTQLVGSCFGDSGGPLAVRDAAGTGWIVAGISSSIGSFCGDPKSPSNYTRVSKFENWIRQNTGISTAVQDGISPWFAAEPGSIRLLRSGFLEISWLGADGRLAHFRRGYFPAGNIPLPGAASAGNYLVRVKGLGTSAVQFVRVIP